MDEHFRTAPFEQNLPVILGLLTVWYTDFFDAQTVAVLPYEQYLKRFPAYLQQLTMESNGKHVTLDGEHVDYQTGPIYWGEPGPTASTRFYQLIHQGTRLIPCDFIGFCKTAQPSRRAITTCCWPTSSPRPRRWRSARRPSRSKPKGRPTGWCRTGSSRATVPPTVLGRPSSRPATLGKLVALYEHSVFTQGTIWQIDSFDQWGVELGKVLAQHIIAELTAPTEPSLAA